MSMARVIMLFFICFISGIVKAQKVSIKKGVAYVDDSAYCKVTGKKGLLGSMETSFSIMSLDDKELIYVKEDEGNTTYTLSFLTLNEKIKTNKTEFGIDWKTSIVKALFKSGVIKNNALDASGKNIFALKYKIDKEDSDDNGGTGEPAKKMPLVERNKSAEIYVFGDYVEQDFKKIATFSSTTEINNSNDIVRLYIIKLPTGQKIAEFKAEEFKAENNNLYILAKDRTIRVDDISGNTIGQQMEILKKVAKVLIGENAL
jgi:hypothetical protein